MDRNLARRNKCALCGALYLNPQPDGASYQHTCAPPPPAPVDDKNPAPDPWAAIPWADGEKG